jgi:hypothetical protein
MPIPQTEKTAQERAGELHTAGDLTAAAELLAAASAVDERAMPPGCRESGRAGTILLAELFCYARIDCDIYQPRLADGAIVVFDDWPHTRGFAEQQALEEWLPTVPGLQFEFPLYGAIGHFYTRIHRLS